MRARTILPGILAAALACGFALAGPGHAHRRDGAAADRLDRLAAQLDLTEGQKTRMKEIFEQHRAEGLGEASGRAREARRTLRQTLRNPDATEEAVRDAARKSADAEADVAVERHRAFVEAYSVLTPEQRERAKELRAK